MYGLYLFFITLTAVLSAIRGERLVVMNNIKGFIKQNDEPVIFCHAFGTAEECPDCLNNSCYEPCKIEFLGEETYYPGEERCKE